MSIMVTIIMFKLTTFGVGCFNTTVNSCKILKGISQQSCEDSQTKFLFSLLSFCCGAVAYCLVGANK